VFLSETARAVSRRMSLAHLAESWKGKAASRVGEKERSVVVVVGVVE